MIRKIILFLIQFLHLKFRDNDTAEYTQVGGAHVKPLFILFDNPLNKRFISSLGSQDLIPLLSETHLTKSSLLFRNILAYPSGIQELWLSFSLKKTYTCPGDSLRGYKYVSTFYRRYTSALLVTFWHLRRIILSSISSYSLFDIF